MNNNCAINRLSIHSQFCDGKEMARRWVDGAQRSECSAALVVMVRDCGESLLAGNPRGFRLAPEDGSRGWAEGASGGRITPKEICVRKRVGGSGSAFRAAGGRGSLGTSVMKSRKRPFDSQAPSSNVLSSCLNVMILSFFF